MPEIIKLEDGTEREVPTQEELDALNNKAQEAETKQTELQKQFEETQKELSKLKNKDYNFRKLEELTEEEKAKLSAQEKALMAKAEELDTKQNEFQKTMQESWKNEAMATICGTDKELQEKVKANLDKVKYDANTKEGIQEGIRNAYALLGQGAPVNPLFNTGGGAGKPPQQVNKNVGGESWANDEVDSNLAKNLGVNEKDLEDYEKFPYKGSSKETGNKSGFQN